MEPTLSESFRHSGWHRDRQRVYQALRDTAQSISRITAFVDCGVDAYVLQSAEPPYQYRLAGSHCHDRLCVPCARDRSRSIAANVVARLAGQPCRFLTLTLRQTDADLRTQLDRVTSCFARLRQRKLWKDCVAGGCAFVELKWASHRQTWNVHLHCLLHGKYIPQADLSLAWLKITQDSMIADIRFIRNNAVAARYVTKYASKPFNQQIASDPELLREVVVGTQNKRLVITFGDWRGIQLTQTPTDELWVNLGHVEDFAQRARSGDPDALDAMVQIFGSRASEYLAFLPERNPSPCTRAPPPNDQLTFAFAPDAITVLQRD